MSCMLESLATDRPCWRARGGWVRTALLIVMVSAIALGCGDEELADAYGRFEADEVTVAAEAAGRLETLRVREGQPLALEAEVGLIDTTQAALQRAELVARRRAARTRTVEVDRQVDVLRVQLATAQEEYERTRRLVDGEAATPQQLNLRRGEVQTLEQQLEAARVQGRVAMDEIGVIDAQLARVAQQVDDSAVRNPVAGTVTATYVDAGEFVRVGQALYDVARLDTLTLKAYVSGARLSAVRLGQAVHVRYDVGESERATRRGLVTRIADEAEFTPTPIQTREERVDLVYAVEVAVPNADGALKVGMPGELVIDFEAGAGR